MAWAGLCVGCTERHLVLDGPPPSAVASADAGADSGVRQADDGGRPEDCAPSAACPCELGDLRCNVSRIERCRDDRRDWVEIETCASEEVCLQSLSRLTADPTLPPVCDPASRP